MLASQAESAISIALGGAHDARLRELYVSGVALDPGSGRLVVRLTPPHPLDSTGLTELLDALGAARAWLRGQVAADIHRKKTPDLAFVVDPRGASWTSSDVAAEPPDSEPADSGTPDGSAHRGAARAPGRSSP